MQVIHHLLHPSPSSQQSMLQNSSSKRKLRQAAAKRPLKAKVVVLGDSGEFLPCSFFGADDIGTKVKPFSGVGKTSILLRHDGQGFTSLLSSTLGASYVCSKSIHGGREVELQIVSHPFAVRK